MSFADGLKRFSDVIAAGVALLGSTPVLLAAALCIKLGSRGPVLYRSTRAGTGGRPFSVLKFRTMVTGAQSLGSVTVGRDARVTRVGKFLRATKIDELPQLVNVLRGEMSIVGPRPESMDIVESHYRPADAEVLSVRPGLTCPGNLLYYVFHEDLESPPEMSGDEYYVSCLLPTKLLADLHYVRNRSLRYDTELILTTIRIIVCKNLGIVPRWRPKFASEPHPGWEYGCPGDAPGERTETRARPTELP